MRDSVAAWCVLLAMLIASAASAQPDDPWLDAQWAFAELGLGDEDELQEQLGANPSPVVVAVVDTGIDWNHLDLPHASLWRNAGETAANGIDDDGNGFVDDLIGWDFFASSRKPWDYDGHGTFIAGIVAAQAGNAAGIAGINPHARIMAVKALNNFGHTRASYLAKGIVYAVDNGARLINISAGGLDATPAERAALDYAQANDALIVVAAGNEDREVADDALLAHPAVLTVAATGPDGRRAPFSNWGSAVDIAAPGVDIVSLRARRTDTLRDAIPDYEPGSAYLGADRRYYRATGTSFAAPHVTAVASLLLSRSPGLPAETLRRILLNAARDIETPGVDQLTGYGALDAAAALAANPDFYIDARITGVAVVSGDEGPGVEVTGTAGADAFEHARLMIGAGEAPASWTEVATIDRPVGDGVLGHIPAGRFAGAKTWMLRLVVRHAGGREREARYRLNVG